MPPLVGSDTCFAHSEEAAEVRQLGIRRSVEVRQARAAAAKEARHRSAADWVAHKLEERGERIAQAWLDAAENGDWRAAVAAYERVYGKPTERLESVTVGVDMRTLEPSALEDARAQLTRQLSVTRALPQGDEAA